MKNTNETKYVEITDVTLREGDQAPLTSFTGVQKTVVALMLAEMGVDTIEVWFWANSADFENIKNVSENIWNTDIVISSLWRSVESDTIASLNSLKNVNKPRVHIFVAMSEEHIRWKFQRWGISFEEAQNLVLKNAIKNIDLVKQWGIDNDKVVQIEFSPEDATWNSLKIINWKKYFRLSDNLDFDFLIKICEEAIIKGATIINVPDTLWNLSSNQTYDFFKELDYRLSHLKAKYDFWLSSHIHNDLWTATANTIEAVRWWAKYVETTMFWIWERAWNAPTEEVIWFISEKWHDLVEWIEFKVNPRIKMELLWPVSEFVKTILWLDKSLQRPFVWALSDIDGSWVHNANGDLYWWSKNKDKYWWDNFPEFFSARWWTNQLLFILNKYWINEDKNNISNIVKIFCKKAEQSRALYWNNVYATYLEEKWDYEIKKLNIQHNHLELEISIKWKNITFNWKVEWDNGIINTFISLINDYFGYERVLINDLQIKSKVNLLDEINKFRDKIWTILSDDFNDNIDRLFSENSENTHHSETEAISQVVLEVDWNEVYSIISDFDTSKAWIKSILEWIIHIL